jgi:hypothetical protein
MGILSNQNGIKWVWLMKEKTYYFKNFYHLVSRNFFKKFAKKKRDSKVNWCDLKIFNFNLKGLTTEFSISFTYYCNYLGYETFQRFSCSQFYEISHTITEKYLFIFRFIVTWHCKLDFMRDAFINCFFVYNVHAIRILAIKHTSLWIICIIYSNNKVSSK